jgi:hypothetical protein
MSRDLCMKKESQKNSNRKYTKIKMRLIKS